VYAAIRSIERARSWCCSRRTELNKSSPHIYDTLFAYCQMDNTHARRSISERVLGARLVLQQACMARALSFEYLNRQLVWQELSELLLFLLPLLNVTHLRRRLLSHLPRIIGSRRGAAASGACILLQSSRSCIAYCTCLFPLQCLHEVCIKLSTESRVCQPACLSLVAAGSTVGAHA